jgi:AcrR family transcriptional regulator
MDQVKRKGRPLAHDRGQLLAQAQAVAAAKGYDALRFADVSEASGVPISSLQYMFGTRDQMVREVLSFGVSEELTRLRSSLSAAGTSRAASEPWRRIEQFIKVSITADHARRRDGWLLWMEYLRAASRDVDLAAEAAQLSHAWREVVGAAVDDGVASGVFQPKVATEEVAATLVALVDGLSLQVEASGGTFGQRRAVRAATSAARLILGVNE